MGKTMNLSGMSDEECETILSVVNRDSNLRIREQQRISKIRQEIDSEYAKRSILSQENTFNRKYCILCCSSFNFLFNKKLLCHICKFNICRNCALYDEKQWICRICEKQRSLYYQTLQWNCDNDTKANTILFGSAKLLKIFLEQRKVHSSANSDNCSDSGIIINGNFQHSEDMNGSQLNVASERSNDPSTEEDPAIIQVREHIEVLVEGFLGGSLDSAHVDRPFIDEQYNELFVEFKEKLSLAILDLTRALYLSLHNKPIYDDNIPANAHVALKEIIILITKSASQLPCLMRSPSESSESPSPTNRVSFNFNSYEELLATAIINQIVEACQSRYDSRECQVNGGDHNHLVDVGVQSDNCESESVLSFSDHQVFVTTDDEKDPIRANIVMDSPSFVLHEHIEEITTKSYSDFEDDKKNGVEIDNDYYYPELNIKLSPLKVPFPEAGVDIVDINLSAAYTDDELSEDSGIRLTNILSWEENWLFQKKKQIKNPQNLILYGYNSLELLDSPVAMLVPNPSQRLNATIGSNEIDEISDLSEHNSVGSLEFSDDQSDDIEINEIKSEPIIANISVDNLNKLNLAQQKRKNYIRKAKPYIPPVPVKLNVPQYVPLSERNNTENSTPHLDPCFVIKPGDANVQCGILVQFCCRVKGTKPLQIAWFKNGDLINNCDNFRCLQTGNDHIFEITKTNLDDAAQYSCVAFNQLGQQWCDFNLVIRNQTFVAKKRERKQKPIPKHANKGKLFSPKSPPLVIQRTWAERAAEIEKRSSSPMSQEHDEYHSSVEMPPVIDATDDPCDPLMIEHKIAEREHRKWESAINWPENPYTKEKINERMQKQNSMTEVSEEELTDAQKNVDSSFFGSKAKDLSRYKKDYYVPSFSKDETVCSLEESEYSNSKYFEVKNEESIKIKPQPKERHIIYNSIVKSEDVKEEITSLPSVKALVSKFSSNDDIELREPIKLEKNKTVLSKSFTNLSESRGNYSVHSLTARSMSREFPRMSNKIVPRNSKRLELGLSANNICQESGSESSPCSPTNEGYVSDESNSSFASNAGKKISVEIRSRTPEKRVSRNVLQRASYWEKRCERGLLSDSSVSEDFPPIDPID